MPNGQSSGLDMEANLKFQNQYFSFKTTIPTNETSMFKLTIKEHSEVDLPWIKANF